MSDSAVMSPPITRVRPEGGPRLESGTPMAGVIAFLSVLVAGLGYAVVSLVTDMNAVGEAPLAYGAFALLGLALLIALAFEFVNGFHDTAQMHPVFEARTARGPASRHRRRHYGGIGHGPSR